MFLATLTCYLNGMSVLFLHTHMMNTGKIYCIFAFLNSQKKQQNPRPLLPAFNTITRKLIVSNLYPHFSWHRNVSVYLFAVSPSYYIWSYHSLSRRIHVQTYSTMYINYINKLDNFLQCASEISGMIFQGNSSNRRWDTAKNVHCCSGTVHLITDSSI